MVEFHQSKSAVFGGFRNLNFLIFKPISEEHLMTDSKKIQSRQTNKGKSKSGKPLNNSGINPSKIKTKTKTRKATGKKPQPATPEKSDLIAVTSEQPCPICKKDSWCSLKKAGNLICCRRSNGADSIPGWICTKESIDKQGAPYTIWKLDLDLDEVQLRDEVYTKLLDSLSLTLPAKEALLNRGLTAKQIKERHYKFLGDDASRNKAVAKLLKTVSEDKLVQIPGFFLEGGKIKINGPSGILIPVRNSKGLIVSILIRPLKTTPKGKKYLYLSSTNKNGPKALKSVHVPRHTGDTGTVRVTEGVLKADVASSLSGMLTIGLPGLYGISELMTVLTALKTTKIHLAFDADFRDKPTVSTALIRLYQQLKADFPVTIEVWEATDGKGIDDVLYAKATIVELTDEEARKLVKDLENKFGPVLPTIVVTSQEQRVNDQALLALAADEEVYTRFGELVWICPADNCPPGVKIPPGLPQINRLPEATLREKLSACADWRDLSHDESLVPTSPPNWCVKAIAKRNRYPKLRVLVDIVTGPVLRADGTILMTKGYDAATGLFLTENYELSIPDQISSHDVESAKNKLLDLVQDFPFENDAHRSTWIAKVLTLVSRYASDGIQPLFLYDANTPGSGKGLLLDLAVIIASGSSPNAMTVSGNDEEMRKRITSLALAGKTFAKLDNVDVPLGGAALEAAITTGRWGDRLLSSNDMVDLSLRILFSATGNNVVLTGDMPRRVALIRLVSPHERPETRTDFKIKDIRTYCLENRRELLEAVFTLLIGFIQAGRPKQTLKAWESFTDWSSLVRATVVWAGLPDPADASQSLTTVASVNGEALTALFEGLQILGKNEGLSSAEILRKISEASSSADPEHVRAAKMLRDAIGLLCPDAIGLPTAGTLGKSLMKHKDRVVGAKCLASVRRNNSSVWRVKELPDSDQGEGDVQGDLGDQGDRGDQGDVLNPKNFQDRNEINNSNISGVLNNSLSSLISLKPFQTNNEELF
jgi:hypothetical protein